MKRVTRGRAYGEKHEGVPIECVICDSIASKAKNYNSNNKLDDSEAQHGLRHSEDVFS
jgi:hypothetical protein